MEEFDPIAYINEPRWQKVRPGLERITELLERMGRPQDRLKFVHVAGTNGKGSTCAYIASILQEGGYRTGLFTSPYIIEFEERIRVNGENIPSDALRDITLFVREHSEAMAEISGEHPTEFELMTAVAFEHFARSECDIVVEHPTEFELMTAVAFEHFARSECDIVVCEVGLGGRLDSTNIIDPPEACVITRIGLDHTEFLGDTPAKVAAEKAGIIKPGSAVVSWPQEDEGALQAIVDAAKRCGANVVVPDMGLLKVGGVSAEGIRSFTYGGESFTTKLLGSYQPSNAALAIETARQLRERGWKLTNDVIERGVANASWPGRFEVVSDDMPVVVVDGGHNPQGAEVLADSLRDVFDGRRIVFLMSVLADKDYPAMIEQVAPLGVAWVCVTSPNAVRALSADDLASEIRKHVDASVVIETADGFASAMKRAREIAGSDGVVCAFGSLYSIAEIKKAL